MNSAFLQKATQVLSLFVLSEPSVDNQPLVSHHQQNYNMDVTTKDQNPNGGNQKLRFRPPPLSREAHDLVVELKTNKQFRAQTMKGLATRLYPELFREDVELAERQANEKKAIQNVMQDMAEAGAAGFIAESSQPNSKGQRLYIATPLAYAAIC